MQGGRDGNGDHRLLLCPSVLPKATLTDTARSPARLVGVSEPREGNCRAVLVSAERDPALGRPGLAELCHPPS